MRKDFLEIAERAERLAQDMERLCENMTEEDYKELSNRELVSDMEVAKDKLEDFVRTKYYFEKDFKTGNLEYSDENGRFALYDAFGTKHEFCCGYRLELRLYDEYDECDKWYFGTVEHSNSMGGYYFKCSELDNNIALKANMYGRIRW